jgi:O-antigen ligase
MTPRDLGRRAGAAIVTGLAIVLLSSLASVDHVSPLILAALVALALLAAVRPHAALLVLAALVPIASWIGRSWNPFVSWAETLVIAFAAGYCARGLGRGSADGSDLDAPIALAAVVVAASLAVQLLVDGWRFGYETLRLQVWDLFRGAYFLPPAAGDHVDSSMRLFESLLLLRTASATAQRVPGFQASFARWFVASAAAAGMVNIGRLWQGAERLESPLSTFVRYLRSVRLNVHYGDLNAASSYFVMAAGPAVALAWRRLRWSVALLPILGGLWIAGSRAAMVAGFLAAMLPASRLAPRIGRRNLRVAAVACIVLVLAFLAAAVASYAPQRGNQARWSTALYVRWELARTSLRMVEAYPSFGVGIGRYYQRSAEFSSPELLEVFPAARNENAHNNFLQILAELGVIGFAAMGWVLWTAGARVVRTLAAHPRDPLPWGMAAGLIAFVISWFGGHPLVIDEPAFMFWLLLGAACGTGAASVSRARSLFVPWGVVALAAVIGLTVPVRVARERADTSLEHHGISLSQWQDALEGVRYRIAGETSAVFVPSDAQSITVPLRAGSPGNDVQVELRLDGRSANVISVPSDRWYFFKLMLPTGRERPRFHRLELRVLDPHAPRTLMIGKVEPR